MSYSFAGPKAVRKYLQHYGEPEARQPGEGGEARYGQVLTVPAYGEAETLERLLETMPPAALGPLLVIVVVNGRVDSPAWVHANNQRSLDFMRRTFPARGGDALRAAPFGDLWIVDRSRPDARFAPHEGVGLARKLAADLALGLWAAGRVRGRFIHCTDADAKLPADYFGRAAQRPEAAVAWLYPFAHWAPDAWTRQAVAQYECGLRHYVLGLACAGSPYAYHTIGSTIAVEATAYARVRGFPKRTGAEDFYLLNKVAKLGPIRRVGGEPIRLLGRPSPRVPFGTGPAVRRITPTEPWRLYDPTVFRYLRVVLGTLPELVADDAALEPRLARAGTRAELDGELLGRVAAELGLARALSHARRVTRDASRRVRHVHVWLDGFRTLALIHRLRDRGHPMLPWDDALNRAGLVPRGNDPVAAAHQLARREDEQLTRPAGLY